jgi:hypothetical protein
MLKSLQNIILETFHRANIFIKLLLLLRFSHFVFTKDCHKNTNENMTIDKITNENMTIYYDLILLGKIIQLPGFSFPAV